MTHYKVIDTEMDMMTAGGVWAGGGFSVATGLVGVAVPLMVDAFVNRPLPDAKFYVYATAIPLLLIMAAIFALFACSAKRARNALVEAIKSQHYDISDI